MIRRRVSIAVYGMLHYYGVMPVADLFVLSHRCGLCGFPDYDLFREKIQRDLVDSQQVYVYKDALCHKWVHDPAVIAEIQQATVAAGYKRFSLQAYLSAGRTQMIWSEPFCDLRDALQGNPGVRVPAATLQHALVELWRELNNMQELVTVTAQWVQQLHLPWQPEDREYMHVLAALRNVAAQMPQWHCKGYSPLELAMLEEEEIC